MFPFFISPCHLERGHGGVTTIFGSGLGNVLTMPGSAFGNILTMLGGACPPPSAATGCARCSNHQPAATAAIVAPVLIHFIHVLQNVVMLRMNGSRADLVPTQKEQIPFQQMRCVGNNALQRRLDSFILGNTHEYIVRCAQVAQLFRSRTRYRLCRSHAIATSLPMCCMKIHW